MTDLRTHADELREQFSDHLDLEEGEVLDRLETLVEEYKVPVDEARRSVRSHYLDEAGLEGDEVRSGGAGSEAVNVEDIDEDDQWVELTAKVVDLWDEPHESIAQTGLLGDETGRTKFTSWESGDLPELEEGAVYRFANAVTDEYDGQYSVTFNRTTTVEELETDIEVGDQTVEAEGALVDIQDGSGLIKRCPEEDCTRVLQNGRCSEHGEVEGEFDLRIKGVLDDGETVHDVLLDREATEELTDFTLEDAKDMAMDALDTTVVADEMRSNTIGRYYRVSGPTFRRYLLVDEMEELAGPVDVEDTLQRARSI
jgi:ssDNA-binding replication factor A large subunit